MPFRAGGHQGHANNNSHVPSPYSPPGPAAPDNGTFRGTPQQHRLGPPAVSESYGKDYVAQFLPVWCQHLQLDRGSVVEGWRPSVVTVTTFAKKCHLWGACKARQLWTTLAVYGCMHGHYALSCVSILYHVDSWGAGAAGGNAIMFGSLDLNEVVLSNGHLGSPIVQVMHVSCRLRDLAQLQPTFVAASHMQPILSVP